MAFALRELLWVGVLPCCVAALAMFLCKWLALPTRAVWAKSVGGGYIVGQLARATRVGWRAGFESLAAPREAGDWLPWLVAAAVGITVLAAYAPGRWQRSIVGLALLLSVVAPVRLLAGSVYVTSRWSALEKLAVVAIWAAALAIVWTCLALGRACGQSRLRGGLLVIVAIAMAVILTISGSLVGGERCGMVAAALAGATGYASAAWAFSRRRGTETGAGKMCSSEGLSGAAGAITMSLGGLLLLGYFYAELKLTVAVLLGAALCVAGGNLPTIRPEGKLWQAVFRCGLCLALLAAAFVVALSTIQSDSYR
jgi:hypothetical protein